MHGKREFADKIKLRTLKLEIFSYYMCGPNVRRCHNTKRVRKEKDGKEESWEEDTDGVKG